MKKFNTLLLLAVFAGILSSCSSVKIFKLSAEEEYYIYKGKEVIEKEDEKYYTALSYENFDYQYAVFYVYLENNSNKSVIIDPSKFYLESENLPETNAHSVLKTFAVNPEEKIGELNRLMSERENEHGTTTCLNCLFGSINFVSEIASDEEDADPVGAVEEWSENQDEENVDFEIEMADMDSEKYFWENELLRITTLKPDEQIGGLVYFIFDTEKEYNKITIPVGNTNFKFKYKLIEFN